jgi:signal transduction histidine kinase
MRHGHATEIVITLAAGNEKGSLVIEDDGSGVRETATNQSGMGLQIMNYRARMIGGSLVVQKRKTRGTRVKCVFPLSKQNEAMKRANL